jgi:hypothetical protein
MQPDLWGNNQKTSPASMVMPALFCLACSIPGVLAGGALPTRMRHPPGVGHGLRDAPARVAREVGPAVVAVASELPSQGSFFGS